MNSPSEGVIKFEYKLKKSTLIDEDTYIDIEKWREVLFNLSLIGEYEIEKVGYGNISKRLKEHNQFLISGTQTGKYPNLDGSHYTKILRCDLKKMNLEALGPIAPSSESLTHYSIYQACDQINYVFHIHSSKLWRFMLDGDFDTTSKDVEYGTFDMAQEVQKVIGKKNEGILAMEGHEDGVISYGKSADSAGRLILKLLKLSQQ